MLRAHAVEELARGPARPSRARRIALASLAALASLPALATLAPSASAASAPVVTSVSPDSGPLDGGATVTISGENLTGANTVDFGAHEAKPFTVISEHEITVKPPFGNGAVDVTVTTGAGQSAPTPADEFNYQLSSATVSWGDDGSGQLGIGESGSRVATLPVEVNDLSEVTQLSAAGNTALALLADGQVAAWGGSAVGDGTETAKPSPVRVCAVGVSGACPDGPYLEGVRQVSAGGSHDLALLDDGTVVAWGENTEGDLGDGDVADSLVPAYVCTVVESPCEPENYLGEASAVAAGAHFSLALLGDGTAVSWGSNEESQLGNAHPAEKCGKYSCAFRPVAVTGLSGAVAISAGSDHSFATLEDGEVLAWGDNHFGQLGIGQEGEKLTKPTAVCAFGELAPCAEHLRVAAVGGTSNGGAALLGGGEVATWASFKSDTPELDAGVSGVRALASSPSTSNVLMLLEDGRLLGRGSERDGGLGDGASELSDQQGDVCSPYATGVCPEGPDLGAAGAISLFAAGEEFGLATVTPSHAPVLERIAPATGGLAGGTPVRISGDFLDGVAAVHFGAAEATEVHLISAHELTAVTPPGEGNADVTLSGPEGTSAIMRPADTFAYRGVPEFGRCTKASKRSGRFDGGCKVEEANGSAEWTPWPPGKPGLTLTAGPVSFETATIPSFATSRILITCSSASGSGEVTGPQSTSESLTLSGCSASGLPGGASECQNHGAGSAEISTEALSGRIALIEAKGSGVGLDLAGTGGTIASFACGSVPVTLEGSVIVEVKPNKMLSSQTLKYKATRGMQEFESLKGGPTDVLESSFLGGPFEQTGLDGAVTLESAEAIEIKGE